MMIDSIIDLADENDEKTHRRRGTHGNRHDKSRCYRKRSGFGYYSFLHKIYNSSLSKFLHLLSSYACTQEFMTKFSQKIISQKSRHSRTNLPDGSSYFI